MKYRTKEFLVGLLVLLVVGLTIMFGWLMGVVGPFTQEARYHLLYGFAGGVEVGSPVRVSGVKVGKVEKIEFLTENEAADGSASLKVTIGVSKKAARTVRQDSKFYVNMAGLIGERYVEITPGSATAAALESGATLRGEDPPRIDQLLSQGYGVFGRIQELIQDNEKSITEFLTQMSALMADANKFLGGKDRKKFITLVDNLTELTEDLKSLAHGMNNPEAREVFRQMSELVKRAHQIDKPTLKKFLQEEGIRARIF